MSKLTIGLVAALSLTAFAGCKKKEGGGQTSDCAGAMDHAATVAKADPKNAGMDPGTVQKLTASSVQRCTEDKWAPDAISCFNASKDQKGLMDCMGKLTPDQQKKFGDAMMAAEGGVPPGGGSPPPAGSGSGMGSGSAAPAGSDMGSGSGSGSAH